MARGGGDGGTVVDVDCVGDAMAEAMLKRAPGSVRTAALLLAAGGGRAEGVRRAADRTRPGEGHVTQAVQLGRELEDEWRAAQEKLQSSSDVLDASGHPSLYAMVDVSVARLRKSSRELAQAYRCLHLVPKRMPLDDELLGVLLDAPDLETTRRWRDEGHRGALLQPTRDGDACTVHDLRSSTCNLVGRSRPRARRSSASCSGSRASATLDRLAHVEVDWAPVQRTAAALWRKVEDGTRSGARADAAAMKAAALHGGVMVIGVHMALRCCCI